MRPDEEPLRSSATAPATPRFKGRSIAPFGEIVQRLARGGHSGGGVPGGHLDHPGNHNYVRLMQMPWMG